MLQRTPGANVRVFAVWEPILATDWQRPGGAATGRIPDSRALQFWDRPHLLAQRLATDARDPQPQQHCCLRDGFLWDLAAVYPPGVRWTDHLPPAVFFDGPVAQVKDALTETLSRAAR